MVMDPVCQAALGARRKVRKPCMPGSQPTWKGESKSTMLEPAAQNTPIPVTGAVVYFDMAQSRSSAAKREYAIKRMTLAKKAELLNPSHSREIFKASGVPYVLVQWQGITAPWLVDIRLLNPAHRPAVSGFTCFFNSFHLGFTLSTVIRNRPGFQARNGYFLTTQFAETVCSSFNIL